MSQPIHLISTRKLKAENKGKLESLGFTIEDGDFVEIRYTLDANKKRILIENTSPLIFTSQHAVWALEKLIPELKQKEAFAILGVTANEAEKLGFTIIGTARDAGSLAEIIVGSYPESVLHVTGNMRRSELARWLAEADIRMQILEVYEKILVGTSLWGGDAEGRGGLVPDGIIFFSPSQVDAFLVENTLPEDIPACVIGHTTAHHLEKLGHKNIIIAPESSEESVVETAVNYFHFLSSWRMKDPG